MVVFQIFPLECNHCCHLQSRDFQLKVLEIIGSCCFCRFWLQFYYISIGVTTSTNIILVQFHYHHQRILL
jgi:hypothetical protein